MKSTINRHASTTVAARIAGEDIKPGDFVAVLSEVIELPSFFWSCSSVTLPVDEPVRSRYLPRDAGQPFRVVAICLPFVYANRPRGSLATFDIRRHQLVRLDPQSGREVWKRLRKSR
ncbi:MAG: hypothetical protein KDA92_13610 [Planctomycetales bacterium]|nr:hypothetical protein [Planctomycetales bacterium]